MDCVWRSEEEEHQEEVAKLRRELDRATRLLCGVFRTTPQALVDGSPELVKWFAEHDEQDRKRKAEEG